MGHAEMLLAVAGLDKLAVEGKVEILASSDWSSFSARDRAGYFFAKKVSQHPSEISDEDVKSLRQYFGPHASLDLIWHCCWCNFMTRVADAYQIPLERENVFLRPPQPAAKPDPDKQPAK